MLNNTRSLFAALPSDVMCRIARERTLWGRIALTHTCHRIRRVLLADSTLWTTLAGACIPSEVFYSFISRSAAEPVHLWIKLNAFSTITPQPVLSAGAANLVRLGLTFNAEDVYVPYRSSYSVRRRFSDWLELCQILSSRLPRLTTLNLIIHCHFTWELPLPVARGRPESWNWQLPTSLLANDAEMLCSFVLMGVQLPPQLPPALARLTTFDYRAATHLTAAVLDEILAFMPQLRILSLSLEDYRASEQDSESLCPHPSLRQVIITRFSENGDLLQYFTRHQVRDILLRASDLDMEAMIRILPSIVAASIGISSTTVVFKRPSKFLLQRIYISHVSSQTAGLALTTAWSALTVLDIRESLWTVRGPFPAMPKLHTLRVYLSSCRDVRQTLSQFGDMFSIFALASETTLECPELRVLELSSTKTGSCPATTQAECCCRNGYTVSLVDVHAFVRHCLRFTSSVLDELRIYGMECVDPDPASALEALSTVATRVEMLPFTASHMLSRNTYLPVDLTRAFEALEGQEIDGTSLQYRERLGVLKQHRVVDPHDWLNMPYIFRGE